MLDWTGQTIIGNPDLAEMGIVLDPGDSRVYHKFSRAVIP